MTEQPPAAAQPVSSRVSPAVATYIGLVTVAAALMFAATLHTFPPGHWTDLAVFVFAAIASERWAVASSFEGSMSLSLTVAFAATLLYGPAFASTVAVCGVVGSDLIISRRHWSRVLFNSSQVCLTAGLAAIVYRQLRVAGPVDLKADALAIAVSAVIFLLVNDTLVAGIISLSGRSFFHEWMASFREMGILYVSMTPLGALLAFAYQDSPWNILYFPFLILVIYTGFKLYGNLQSETDHALALLADTVDKRDEYTYAHSQRVAEYAGDIAHHLDLPRKEIDLIVSAARVHDLGKIATDNRILYKQASLTADERKAIIAHPADGSELAGQFSMYRKGRDYIRHHHERWDGRGYPDGLAGTHIPLGARVITVADAYDAMTSDRPYRAALPPEIALAELRRGAGRQFDPDLVEAFIACYRGAEQPRLVALPTATEESCSSS
jgi:HD-GYP domain-containing protein (c-di-GMP phosphodiesterase class II)